MAGHWTETEESLSDEVKNITRALKTVIEELEAIMYYHQRVDVTTDTNLQEVFAHNRDEEIEHACMTLEWLRRNMEGWDKEMKNYLFTSGSLLSVEDEVTNDTSDETENGKTSTGLKIGNLK